MNVRRTRRNRRRFRNSSRARLFAVLAAGAFLVAVALIIRLCISARPSSITISAGNALGIPALKWMSLDGEVPGGDLRAKAVATEGSLEMLERVDRGDLDFALVQGGFNIDRFQNVRQVMGLTVVPLLLLVKEELHAAVVKELGALRGKTVNLGSGKRTGTYWLSRELLEFAGLSPGDYRATNLTVPQLRDEANRENLPDAVFVVTRPPSLLVRHLAVDHRYRLVPLPFGEAFRAYALVQHAETPPEGIVVRREHIPDAVIPAFSYGVTPAVPPQTITTLGSRQLLVTNRRTSSATVIRVLETLLESRWAKAMQPPVDKTLLQLPPELAMHPGAADLRDRGEPLITGESLGFLSNALQILIPFGGGLLFLLGWFKNRKSARRERSFDQFLALVSAVERHGSSLHRKGDFDAEALHQLHRELSGIKESAFHYVEGHETSSEAFVAILLGHIADVRGSLAELHERAGSHGERLDDRLTATGGDANVEDVSRVGDRGAAPPSGMHEDAP
jgi:TRAP-type uncharacterized transport system substrate-binding protein